MRRAALERTEVRWIRSLVPGAAVASCDARTHGRLGERRAGLDAATRALASLGARPATVTGHGDDGRPLWPRGWTGSISHDRGLALAVVAPLEGSLLGVGVDVECALALPWVDAELVVSPAEAVAARRAGVDPTELWSAKEAAFKSWSHASASTLPGVDPREIVVDVARGTDRRVAVEAFATGVLARHLDERRVPVAVRGMICRSDRLVTVVRVG